VTIDQALVQLALRKPSMPFMGGRVIHAGPVAKHFMKRVWAVVRRSGADRASPA